MYASDLVKCIALAPVMVGLTIALLIRNTIALSLKPFQYFYNLAGEEKSLPK